MFYPQIVLHNLLPPQAEHQVPVQLVFVQQHNKSRKIFQLGEQINKHGEQNMVH